MERDTPAPPGSHAPEPTPRLRTARLDLLPLSVSDTSEMVGVLGDRALYAFTGGQPPDQAALRERFERFAAGRSPEGTETWHNWVMRVAADGVAIGTVQATVSVARPAAEIGWIVGVPWQGRGYASEAAKALVEWLERRGVTSVAAHVHPEHKASERVAERAGLVLTADAHGGERVWRRTQPR